MLSEQLRLVWIGRCFDLQLRRWSIGLSLSIPTWFFCNLLKTANQCTSIPLSNSASNPAPQSRLAVKYNLWSVDFSRYSSALYTWTRFEDYISSPLFRSRGLPRELATAFTADLWRISKLEFCD
jgi:hypothetical protein